MTNWYESHVDRQIREAQERGEFDNLPGAGKPIPGIGGNYDENWWLKELLRREDIHGGVPPTLVNARTGLLTPPGSKRRASANNTVDRSVDSEPTCNRLMRWCPCRSL